MAECGIDATGIAAAVQSLVGVPVSDVRRVSEPKDAPSRSVLSR
jgi:hypothetical protein